MSIPKRPSQWPVEEKPSRCMSLPTDQAWPYYGLRIPARVKLSPLVIAMYALDGPPRFTHIWPFVSLDARAAIRADSVKQGIWPPKGGPAWLTGEMQSTIALPTAIPPCVERCLPHADHADPLARLSHERATLAAPISSRLRPNSAIRPSGSGRSAVAPGAAFSLLIEDAGLLRETISHIKATGVAVFDVEIVRLGPNFDPETVWPFLETCQKLDAKAVLVAGDDPDEARLTASFATFCEAAAPYGLTGDLEFMPWTKARMRGPPSGSPSRRRSPTRACSSMRSMPDGHRRRLPTLRPCRARFSAIGADVRRAGRGPGDSRGADSPPDGRGCFQATAASTLSASSLSCRRICRSASRSRTSAGWPNSVSENGLAGRLRPARSCSRSATRPWRRERACAGMSRASPDERDRLERPRRAAHGRLWRHRSGDRRAFSGLGRRSRHLGYRRRRRRARRRHR